MNKKNIAHKRKIDGADQLLETHLLEVGAIASRLTGKIGLPEVGGLIGLLHDFGKYSQQFQNYIASAVGDLDIDDADYVDAVSLKGKVDHSSAGAQYIWRAFSAYGNCGEGELVGQVLALCIASHHSGLIDCFDKNGVEKFIQRMQKSDEFTHLDECKEVADFELLKTINTMITGSACTRIFKKLLSVTDKKLPFSKIDYFNLGFFTRFLFSALIDADRLNSAEFEMPFRKKERLGRARYFNWATAIARVEQFVTALKPKYRIDLLRQQISENCLFKAQQEQGIYTLTVPTGGGKTYASLRYGVHHAAQHKLDRIIYIVPYTSIIEQNAKAIREVIERDGDQFSWVLEHHSNLEPEQQTWQSKLVAENWDSPIVLTTMVQFLETCFSGGTRSVRRLHQLANSVVIFDEIQTLPINCTHLFCNALNFLTQHCDTTALLCTATQPLLNQLDNSENGQLHIPKKNEIVDDVSGLFNELNRVEVLNQTRPAGWQEDEIAALAIEQYHTKGSCLIIVNTKNWAQKLYQLCQEEVEQESLFHLSTNQCPAHREYALGKIRGRLKNKQPVLCISTQLIEAGVDVSFTSVIRFLAGLDSIAQAAGRCNRHGESQNEQGKPTKGQVFVVNPESETTALLTDIEEGKKAAYRVLGDGFDNLVAPEAIKQYFEYYFYERKGAMSYQLSINKMGRSGTLLDLLSDNKDCPGKFVGRATNAIPMLQQSFREAGKQFQAIDAPTQAVIVPYKGGVDIITELCAVNKDFNVGQYYKLLKQVQKYSVNVFPNVWKKLLDAGAVNEVQTFGIYCLDKRYYSDEFGLSETSVALMENYNL